MAAATAAPNGAQRHAAPPAREPQLPATPRARARRAAVAPQKELAAKRARRGGGTCVSARAPQEANQKQNKTQEEAGVDEEHTREARAPAAPHWAASPVKTSRPSSAADANEKGPRVSLRPFDVRSRDALGRTKGRKIRRHPTTEEPEYEQIWSMHRRFLAECPHGSSALLPQAARGEKDIHVIDCEGRPAGFMAFEMCFPHDVEVNIDIDDRLREAVAAAPVVVPILQQLYVEPLYRRLGVAREAIRQVVPASDKFLVVESPGKATCRALLRLGWAPCGVRGVGMGNFLCLYARTP